MNKTTTNDERFLTGAAKYAAYLKTVEGRLRIDLAFANLQEHLPQGAQPLQALDIGGGTGITAVRLAQRGLHVTVLDESQAMLDIAERTASEAGVAERLTLKQVDAGQLANLFPAGSFDVIVCHNVLEFVDEPSAVLQSVARLLRDSLSIFSVLVRNQAGEVLKSALLNGDLAAADRDLTVEWGDESLYGGRVRLFPTKSLRAMLTDSSFAVAAERGVRVISDYLPPTISRSDEYERILELERKLGCRPDFASVARYTQCLARRADAVMKDVL
jgi:S-adenosylmethionine-dependent methyltransferase